MLEGLQVQEAETYKEWLAETEQDASQAPRFKPLPMRAISHLAGQLLAFGIEAALCKTITVRSFEIRLLVPLSQLCAHVGRRLVGSSCIARVRRSLVEGDGLSDCGRSV